MKMRDREISVRRLLPSVITLLALASGMTGIRFALMGRFDDAVLAIALAAALDVLDGRVAILFKAQSKFGAELDSLADLISFGVAPALIMYAWTLSAGGSLGWLAALLFVLCAALRLARYNTLHEDDEAPQPRVKKIFVGVPTPSGAGLGLLPLILNLAWGWPDPLRTHDALNVDITYVDINWAVPRMVAIWMVVIGMLMVSRLPTPALKGWRIPAPLVLPLLVLVCLVAASLITDPFPTLATIAIVNLALIPVTYVAQKRAAKNATLPVLH